MSEFTRDDWKFALMECGAQSVMTSSLPMMQQLRVLSLVSLAQVSNIIILHENLYVCKRVPVCCTNTAYILLLIPFPGSRVVPLAQYGSGTGPIALDSVTCFGNEENLLDCLFDPDSTEDTHAEDVGVNCTVVCYDNEIRVVDGNTPTEGRVEICFNEVWGTITDDFWSFLDAAVACRQLGFSDQCRQPVLVRVHTCSVLGILLVTNFTAELV